MDSTIMNPNKMSPELLQNEEKAEQISNELVDRIKGVSTAAEAHPIVDEIQVLYEAFPNNESVARNYVECLRVLVCRQTDEADYSKSSPFVSRVSNLYNRFPSNKMIALFYMNCLLCLTFGCKAYDEIALLINKMQLLYKAFPNLYDMNKFYMMGLYRLSNFQSDPEELQHTTEAIRQIYEKVPDDEFFAKYYACSLVNLTKNSESTVAQLRNLHNRFSDNVDIAQYYANGLANLVIEQCEPSVKEKTIEHLENLHKRFPDQYIAELFGKSLISLSKKQETYVELGTTVEKLKQLYQLCPTDVETAKQYAAVLNSYIDKQCWTLTCKKQIEDAKIIAERMPSGSKKWKMEKKGNITLAHLIDALFVYDIDNLSKENPSLKTLALPSPIEFKHSAEQIQKLYEAFPEQTMIVHQYADSLATIACVHTKKYANNNAFDELLHLREKYEKDEYIAERFSEALADLFENEKKSSAKEAVLLKIKTIYHSFPDNQSIAQYYMKCICAFVWGHYNGKMNNDLADESEYISDKLMKDDGLYSSQMTAFMDEDYAALLAYLLPVTILKKIDICNIYKRIHDKYPRNVDIIKGIAIFLDDLCPSSDVGFFAISILEKFYNTYPDNEEIACSYANGCYHLSNCKNANLLNNDNIAQMVNRIKLLYKRFPKNKEISRDYIYFRKQQVELTSGLNEKYKIAEELNKELQIMREVFLKEDSQVEQQ